MTKDELLNKAATVRNETVEGANTAERVGEVLVETINYAAAATDLSAATDDLETLQTQVSTNATNIAANATNISSEATARADADAELLKRIKGISDNSNGATDPFISGGEYTDFSTMLAAIGDDPLTASPQTKYAGYVRYSLNGTSYVVHNIPVNYVDEKWLQAIYGPLVLNDDGTLSTSITQYAVYYRYHTTDGWEAWQSISASTVDTSLKTQVDENTANIAANAEDIRNLSIVVDKTSPDEVRLYLSNGTSNETLPLAVKGQAGIITGQTAVQIEEDHEALAAAQTKLALYPDTPKGIMNGAVERTVGADTIKLAYGMLDSTGVASPEALTLPAATTEAAGLLSATDKTKLDTYPDDYSTVEELVTDEAAAREEADTTLQENIDSEATARADADTTLQANIDTLSSSVSSTVSGQNTDYVSNIAITQESGYPNAVHFTVQKGNSVQYKFSLATATTSVPGLMSPDDKTNLDTLTSGSFTGASYDQTTRYINFTNAAGTTVASVLMVWASSSRAGLMSAGDKKKLDAYPDWETLDARIAALES